MNKLLYTSVCALLLSYSGESSKNGHDDMFEALKKDSKNSSPRSEEIKEDDKENKQGIFLTQVSEQITEKLDEEALQQIRKLYQEGRGYELNLQGDEFLENKEYIKASASFLASLSTDEDNHDLLCFLKRKGFDYKGQWDRPNPTDPRFKEFVNFLAKKLS